MSCSQVNTITPTIGEMPEMQPSAEERAQAAFNFWREPDAPDILDTLGCEIERAYRDGLTAALSSLSPLIETARTALDLDGPGHARHNLDGAIIDIDHAKGLADSVCMATLRRVRDQLGEIERALSTFPAPASQWRPIETAPRDGTRILLLRPGREPACGNWDDDRYANKPEPHWTDDNRNLWGRRDTKTRVPTHWMPIPSPPPAITEPKP